MHLLICIVSDGSKTNEIGAFVVCIFIKYKHTHRHRHSSVLFGAYENKFSQKKPSIQIYGVELRDILTFEEIK